MVVVGPSVVGATVPTVAHVDGSVDVPVDGIVLGIPTTAGTDDDQRQPPVRIERRAVHADVVRHLQYLGGSAATP